MFRRNKPSPDARQLDAPSQPYVERDNIWSAVDVKDGSFWSDGPRHTIKFPPTMNGYFKWTSFSTFHLGPSAEEKIFAISAKGPTFTKPPKVILYDGPTVNHPVLASCVSDFHFRNRPFQMTIPRYPELHLATPEMETISGMPSDKHAALKFSVEVGTGKEAILEDFEWRRSSGKEVKELARHSYGWKLVRLSSPMEGTIGKRSQRDSGLTSEGLEIVAVQAMNSSCSMTKAFKFAFIGSGLTGVMGEKFEIIAVLSGLQLWYIHYQIQMASSAAA